MSVEVNHFDSYWKHFDYLFKQICCCFAFYVYLDQATRFCCHSNARNYSSGKGRQPNDTKRNAHYGQDEGKRLGRFRFDYECEYNYEIRHFGRQLLASSRADVINSSSNERWLRLYHVSTRWCEQLAPKMTTKTLLIYFSEEKPCWLTRYVWRGNTVLE